MSNCKICAFFGHRELESDISAPLETAIRYVIAKHGITTFWCGGYGSFDACAARMVYKVRKDHPDIQLLLVRAYLPISKQHLSDLFDSTIYPEGLENIPQRFAISRRNQWMTAHCDVIISYINHSFGGAYAAYHAARKNGKIIYNLGTL